MSRPAIGLLLVLLTATACAAQSAEPGPFVVATNSILGDIANNLVRSDRSVEVLVPAGTDPHEFQPSIRQAELLRQAELVVANGLGLEAEYEDVLVAAEGAGVRVLRIGELVRPRLLQDGTPDPHVWFDLGQMTVAVEALGQALFVQSESYTQQLRDLDAQISSVLSGVPPERRKLVTSHEVLGYFADRYGFRVVAVITGGSTEAAPSVQDVASVVAKMASERIEVIFTEATGAAAAVEAVAGELPGTVQVVTLYTESLDPDAGVTSYAGLLLTDAVLIADALGG